MHQTNIRTERLNLRPISSIDLDKVHELHSIEEVDRYNTLGIPKNIQVTKSILDNWMLENRRFTFAVELNGDSHTFIGLIGISLGKEQYRNAEVWFKFHPDFWNKGYGTEALKSVIHFGFKHLDLHRIEAGCAVDNIGSIKILEKAGMLREAHTRKLLPLKSGWSDNFGYAILSTD